MNSSALYLQAEPPFYTTILSFLIAPILLGNIIDLTFTKLVGPQSCSFDGTQKVCTVFNKTVPAYLRELARSLIQIIVVFFIIKYFSIYFKSSVFPVTGLSIFLLSQPELFEDFRRFLNSLIFLIKHN